MLTASIMLLYYELFREDVKCYSIYCYIFSWPNTCTCSNVMTKIIGDGQVATWAQQRFVMGSTVGGSSGSNLSILHVFPITSSLVHWATCYQCPSAPQQVLSAITCSATQGKPVNIPQQLFRAFHRPSCWIHPVRSTWNFDIFSNGRFFFFFPMVCLRRVLLNSSAVLAIDNNVISHPAWVWIKSATAFSMKSALSTLAAQLATG